MERNNAWLRDLIGRLSIARAISVSYPALVLKRRPARASTHEAAMRLAALHHFPAIRIERVVDDPLRCIVFVVILEAEMPEAFRDSFKAWPLRLMVQRVVGVGAIND